MSKSNNRRKIKKISKINNLRKMKRSRKTHNKINNKIQFNNYSKRYVKNVKEILN